MSDGGLLGNKGVSSGRGGVVTTKGLLAGSEELPPASLPLGHEPLVLTLSHGPIRIVIPTAINLVLMMSENITLNMRVREASSLQLPSLYKRAHLVAYETDEIATVNPVSV
jgi:hypothetical protein